MSAYTASFGQTKTCFAAAKSAAPGRVARKVGQKVNQITVAGHSDGIHQVSRGSVSILLLL